MRDEAMLCSTCEMAVVIDGVLMHGDNPKGMVSFKSALSPDDVENIRQYLIKRANEDKALGEK